jgi:tetratricopeptide (TPR) repeat protein
MSPSGRGPRNVPNETGASMSHLSTLCALAGVMLVQSPGSAWAGTAVHECDRLAASPSDPRRVVPGIDAGMIDPERAVPACEEAVRLHGREWRFTFQLGRAYYSSRTPERAKPLFEALTQKGDPLAMVSLAVMYAEGRGAAEDIGEAVALFRNAAKLGEPFGMMNLGVAYEFGRGVAQDEAEALHWFLKAAEVGQPKAMVRLASLYENGRGGAKNVAEAMRWYGRAAELGEAHAMLALANLHATALGGAEDMDQATGLILRALETGSAAIVPQLRASVRLWSPHAVTVLQRRLRAIGAYTGAIDGRLEPSTMLAIEAFSKRR